MARPRNIDFFIIREYYGKLGHRLKPIVTKYRSDLSVRLRDIAEKQIPAKLKPIVDTKHWGTLRTCRCTPPMNYGYASLHGL